MSKGNDMNTTHTLGRVVIGLTTAVLVCGGLSLAGLGLASTAQARPVWCPGDNKPALPPWPDFQWNSCYDYGPAPATWIDMSTGIVHPFPMDIPATPPPPNPVECIGLFPLPGADPSHCVI
jgi:hypothetical protein